MVKIEGIVKISSTSGMGRRRNGRALTDHSYPPPGATISEPLGIRDGEIILVPIAGYYGAERNLAKDRQDRNGFGPTRPG